MMVCVWGLPVSAAPTSLVAQAKQCAQVPLKLERLMCFDRLFPPSDAERFSSVQTSHSEIWARAIKGEHQRQGQVGWLRHSVSGDDGEAALWFTVAADNASEQKGILMASCIDKISRLALILPEHQAGARAEISFGGSPQLWRYDDQGWVLHSGRGMAAVALMRSLMEKHSVTLRSNVPALNGWVFHTPNSKQQLTELKEHCQW